jgi:PIN domain nuclease of toxin-antitoxin system
VTLLLDTHVWLWAQESPERMGARVRAQLQDLDSERWLSAVSVLEIARLLYFGKLRFAKPLKEWIRDSMQAMVASPIEITHEIAAEAYSLPGDLHGDPADRILVATARIHGMTLVSADERLLRYRHVNSISAKR